MSFPNANNVLISGSTFIHTYQPATVSSSALALLSSKIAAGASHNSSERFDPPKCHPNTREAILRTILNWMDDPVKSRQIMWVYGSAGVGKSAIAQSIAEMCFNTGKLVGSFFFARGVPNRLTETLFVSTLAYQIMQYLPEIRTSVLDAVEKDPQLFSLSLADQMDKLIIGPLNENIHDVPDGKGLRSRTATLLVVDGLDECFHPQSQSHILDVLSSLVAKTRIPISVMISCRPEQNIRETFDNDPLKSLTVSINLDNISDDTDIDIKTFLLSEFRTMKLNHPAKDHLSLVWPSENEMNQLLMRSQGHFIYASTIIKYIGSRRHSPITRLSYVLKQSIPENDSPFASLDSLYRQILLGAEDFDTVSKIIATLVLGSSPLLPATTSTIELLHSFQPGTVKIALCDLHSIVYVPETPDKNLRMYHASFSDFIFDAVRSGNFYLERGAAHVMLATAILKLSTNSISQFHTSGLFCDHYDQFRLLQPNSMLQNNFLDELYGADLLGLLSSSRDEMYAYWKEVNRICQLLIDLNDLLHPDHDSDLVAHHLQFFIEWITLALSGPVCKFTRDSIKSKETNILVNDIIQSFQSVTPSLVASPEGRRKVNNLIIFLIDIFSCDIILDINFRESNENALIRINDYLVDLLQVTPVQNRGHETSFLKRNAHRVQLWARKSTKGNISEEVIARRNEEASTGGWYKSTLRKLF